MYTRCSNNDCQAAYRVTAEILRNSMGMIRCEKCATVFNALSTIMDAPPEDGDVTDVVSHLKFTEHGDRIVMHPESLAARGWLRKQDTPEPAPSSPPAEEAAEQAGETTQSAAEYTGPTPAERDPLTQEESEYGPIASLERQSPGLLPSLSLGKRLADFIPSKNDIHHAIRNLLRHRKRSAMGLITIVFGVTALLQAGGFIEWSNWTLRESTIQAQLGHVQLVRPKYFEVGESDPYAFLFPGDFPIVDEIEALPEVAYVSPRIAFTGLISFDETSLPFKGEGVFDEKEREISKRLTIIEGDHLSSVAHGAILGKGLAENLGVGVG